MKTELRSLFTEHWKYLAINAACELRLFDAISKEQINAETLRTKLGIAIEFWDSLLGVCEAEGLIIGHDPVLLTLKGELLTELHPETLLYSCLHWAGEHMNSWQQLSYTLKTGHSSFERCYGRPYFEFLRENPQRLDAYHRAMDEYARDDYSRIDVCFEFSQFRSILDVGGGYGALIRNIKSRFPLVNCSLFDLPEVTANVNANGIEVIGGSFFEPILGTYDCIILARVLHDWPDHETKTILRNCYRALSKGGSLLVIEILVDKMNSAPHLLSLNMATICKSYERTLPQYTSLLEPEGYQVLETLPLNELQYIIHTKK